MTKLIPPVSIATSLFVAALTCVVGSTHSLALTLEWSRQIAPHGFAASVFSDQLGNVTIVGETTDSLIGTNAGGNDAWVAKYNSSGDQQWVRQFGTPSTDSAHGVSADSLGNIYVSGSTDGSLAGPYLGEGDAFVVKYSADGNRLWGRQLATTSRDEGWGIAVDDGADIYFVGSTTGTFVGPPTIPENGFLAKYDSLGNSTGIQQREEGSSGFQAVTTDRNGKVYVAGTGDGMAIWHGAIISQYDQLGNTAWTRHVETNSGATFGRDVSSDGMGHVYLSGTTRGELSAVNQGLGDAFLAKYDDAGGLLWIRQLATPQDDEASSVYADGFGNVFIAGYMGGRAAAQGFIAKYDAAGTFHWVQPLDSIAFVNAISSDQFGSLYVAGARSDGAAILAKFNGATIPEPSALALFTLAAIAVGSRARR